MVKYDEIAKLAKVSTTTVSHVINKSRYVSQETEEKVIEAIIKLNYKISGKIKGLIRTNTIGFLASNIKNPFYPDIFEGVENIALKNDYNIFLCNIGYEINKGIKYISDLIKKRADGIIIISSEAEKYITKEFLNSKIPILLVAWKQTDLNLDSIFLDYSKGFLEAIEYLNSLGHKEFYFISDVLTKTSSKIRVNDFIKSVRTYALEYKVYEGNNEISGGMEVAYKILKEHKLPTCIFCSSELTAIGVMKVFRENSIKIPDDVSFIILEDPVLTEIVYPTQSSIELNRYDIGLAAAEILFNRINNRKLPKITKVFKSKFVNRSSVSVPRN